jgi:hypothetical protein
LKSSTAITRSTVVAVDDRIKARSGSMAGYGMCRPLIARATTKRWISEVPSKIV